MHFKRLINKLIEKYVMNRTYIEQWTQMAYDYIETTRSRPIDLLPHSIFLNLVELVVTGGRCLFLSNLKQQISILE